jgi:hypothetical protein
MATSQNSKNPYGICIWEDKAGCHECPNDGKIQCHEDFHYSLWFMAGFMCFIIPLIIGFIGLYSVNLLLLGVALGFWIGYLVIFFLAWEPRMLCSHCPYYAEGNTSTLHCYANHGLPKRIPFKPWPMSRSEQIQFITGLLLFIAIPLPFLWIGNQIIPLFLSGIGFCIWLVILRTRVCNHCINFSCPLNKVPQDIIQEFLERNPTMREAWQKKEKTLM